MNEDSSTEMLVVGAGPCGMAAGFDANRIFIENGREHGARIVRRFVEERKAER